MHFDVFNGDADGICALHQLRLAKPAESVLITGLKRDVALLRHVPGLAGDSVTVLDVSAATNHDALVALLDRGVRVEYFDHHFAGDLPVHPGLRATIDPSPQTCTGMLVDRHLGGSQRVWAVVAAFGDNLGDAARALAAPLALEPAALAQLRELGESLAYNAYGDTDSDLIVHPATLFRILHRYADPFRFIAAEPVLGRIDAARREDLERARASCPTYSLAHARVHVLPDAAWSRRVRGVYGNHLANAAPELAHAILSPNAHGSYTVSVRAPLARRAGADALCREFPTGGGRAAAAGIDDLPREALPDFLRRLEAAFG
jgi:hypothetical protein